ncbi:hypothetical protein ACFPIJ_61885 [Dactylosporangium cerinum]|uniref:Uncharacterized protein n=1 Tax=Dactylosporangium cerinum TaxID=1434730 RepID=A0ABV9WIP1_9ACTN
MQRRGIVTGAACAGTALLAVVLYAINQQHPLSVLGTALLIALAATAAGGLLGFLFGIPRARAGAPDEQPPDIRPRYDANTNLEQVSDWLTKILIGVGLVELTTLLRAGGRLVATIGPAVGDGAQGRVVAGAMLVFFTATGFVLGWLLTRVLLAPALSRADGAALAAFVAAEQAEEAGDRASAETLRAEGVRLIRQATAAAGRYEQVRRGPADPDRTAAMEALVAEAKASTAAGAWLPEQVRDLFREGRDGGRVFALALMEGEPALIDVACVLDAVGASRSAFEQYHALLVTEIAVPAMTPGEREATLRVIEAQTGPRGRIREGTGRRRVAERIRTAVTEVAR